MSKSIQGRIAMITNNIFALRGQISKMKRLEKEIQEHMKTIKKLESKKNLDRDEQDDIDYEKQTLKEKQDEYDYLEKRKPQDAIKKNYEEIKRLEKEKLDIDQKEDLQIAKMTMKEMDEDKIDGIPLEDLNKKLDENEIESENIEIYDWFTELYGNETSNKKTKKKVNAPQHDCDKIQKLVTGEGSNKELTLICVNGDKKLAAISLDIKNNVGYTDLHIGLLAKDSSAKSGVGKKLILYALEEARKYANNKIEDVDLLVEDVDEKEGLVNYYKNIGFTKEGRQFKLPGMGKLNKKLSGKYIDILKKFKEPTDQVQKEMTNNSAELFEKKQESLEVPKEKPQEQHKEISKEAPKEEQKGESEEVQEEPAKEEPTKEEPKEEGGKINKGLSLKEAESLISKLPKYILPAGSVVYKKENVADIDLITTKDLTTTKEDILKVAPLKKEISCKIKKCFFEVTYDGKPIEINIWKANAKELPYMIFGRSYPTKFNIKVRSAVKRKGYTLSDYNLKDKAGKQIPAKTPKDFFNFFEKIGLNIPFRTPEQEYQKELGGGRCLTAQEKAFYKKNNLPKWLYDTDRCDFYDKKTGIEGVIQSAEKAFEGAQKTWKEDPLGVIKHVDKIPVVGDLIKKTGDTIFGKGGCGECGGMPYDGIKNELKGGIIIGDDVYYPMHKLYPKYGGEGLDAKTFQTASNAYRKLFYGPEARQLLEGELHPSIPVPFNFCGPGTRIDLPEVRNFKPYNEVDSVCKQHDIAYHDASGKPNKAELIRQADKEMLKELEKYKDVAGSTLAKLAIQGKIGAENLLPSLIKKISPAHFGEEKKENEIPPTENKTEQLIDENKIQPSIDENKKFKIQPIKNKIELK